MKPVKVAQSLRYDVPIRPFFKVMVAGFTELYGVAWPLLTLGGRRNVAPLYDMCYYSFLIKKAAILEVFDFTLYKLKK